MSIDTKTGIVGGSLLTIFSNITQNEVEKTIVLGAPRNDGEYNRLPVDEGKHQLL